MSSIIRFDVAVTVEDLQTETVLWSGDVPGHLSEHYSIDECAEWASQWVDAVYGLPVAQSDDTVEQWGMEGHSETVTYRAGARYLITVSSRAVGRGFTVSGAVFLTESAAMQHARYFPGAMLGTTEVTL